MSKHSNCPSSPYAPKGVVQTPIPRKGEPAPKSDKSS